jgi:hypothetical protein
VRANPCSTLGSPVDDSSGQSGLNARTPMRVAVKTAIGLVCVKTNINWQIELHDRTGASSTDCSRPGTGAQQDVVRRCDGARELREVGSGLQ